MLLRVTTVAILLGLFVQYIRGYEKVIVVKTSSDLYLPVMKCRNSLFYGIKQGIYNRISHFVAFLS